MKVITLNDDSWSLYYAHATGLRLITDHQLCHPQCSTVSASKKGSMNTRISGFTTDEVAVCMMKL
jgi:hypothetical protein